MRTPVYLQPLTWTGVLSTPGVIGAGLYALCSIWAVWSRPQTKALIPRVLVGVYDVVLVAGSAVTVVLFAKSIYVGGTLAHAALTPETVGAIRAYNALKWVELLDTVFIVLRGNWHQLTPLHIYHHSSILALSEVALRFTPWQSLTPLLLMNSLVHVLLYSYWAVLSFSLPSDALPLAWKKRVTKVQILQFVVGIAHSTIGWARAGFCSYCIIYSASMLVLFTSFYRRHYKH